MYKVTEIGVENVHIIGLCLKIYVIVHDFLKMFVSASLTFSDRSVFCQLCQKRKRIGVLLHLLIIQKYCQVILLNLKQVQKQV